eukprot:TRINITY_DN4032_c0_g1_i1.p1 TRINITY_DN4032_c0_g1~~TRINITY_DN4032_c0_g1_i1.p1  ORF type:complete len:445 (+),score=168.97 TRINITY_DN4032_c0_g1_i1:62-1336(+)
MSQLRSTSQLPPPSAFPAPTWPKASMSPNREAPVAVQAPVHSIGGAMPPPGYQTMAPGTSPIRQREPTPLVVPSAVPVALPVAHAPVLEEMLHEREVLKSALQEAAKETQYLTQTLNTVTNKLRDEEASHALALRQGQDALAGCRRDYEARLEDLQQQLADTREMMKHERDAHLERMQKREDEHLGALQAERQLGNDRLAQMNGDTQGALAIAEEQVSDIKAVLEQERQATKEANEKLLESHRDVQAARDELLQERALAGKGAEELCSREKVLKTQVASLEENIEANGREMMQMKGINAELEARVLDLTNVLMMEQQKVAEGEGRVKRAELLVQQSAQSATASELRAIESHREATLRNRALMEVEHSLVVEKERSLVMAAQHASDYSSRRLADEIRSPLALTSGSFPYQYASVRSASKASVSLT